MKTAFSTRSLSLFADRSLQWAVQARDEKAVRELLAKGHSPLAKTMFGNSPISRAAESGYSEILDLLLTHAKQNEALSLDTLTESLIAANDMQQLACVRVLLLHNAKVPIRTCSVKTGYHMQPVIVSTKPLIFSQVMVNEYTDMLDFGMTELHAATDVKNAAELVAKKPHLLNNQCTTGMTAAHLAAQQGNMKVLEFLVEEAKIDLSPRNIIDETARDTANRHNQDAARYLAAIGAPLHVVGSKRFPACSNLQ